MRPPNAAASHFFRPLIALWCASCSASQEAKPGPLAPSICEATELGRQYLRFQDGTEAYIAPNSFARGAAEEYFLAGTPNYVFGRGPNGQGVLQGRDSILGAIISRETAYAVNSPLGTHLATLVRAAGRDDGGWDVVLGEREVPSVDGPEAPATRRVVRLWYGVYRDRGWHSLEQLPFPSDAEITNTSATSVSELASNGKRLAWAVAAKFEASLNDQVVILERTDSGWKFETVDTGTGVYLGLSYPDTSATLLLSAVKPDTSSLRPGGSDSNSLFVWTRREAWSEPRRIVLGSEDGKVHGPVLTRSPSASLSWASQVDEGYELRAVPHILDSDSILTISPRLAHTRGFAVLPLGDTLVWLSLDAPPTDSIRIVGHSPAGLISYGAISNPFFATFRAADGPYGNQMMMVGGVGVPDRNMVITLITTIQLGCTTQPHRR